MIFGEGERRRTIRTSSENLTKSTEIAAFWQGSFYSCLASVKNKTNRVLTNPTDIIIYNKKRENSVGSHLRGSPLISFCIVPRPSLKQDAFKRTL